MKLISLILPYWNRQEATDISLWAMADAYPDLGLEVIVVDDGSLIPYDVPKKLPLTVRVVRLPPKTQALNPCVPINAGVSLACGDIIALSSPEIVHTIPVLGELRKELEKQGENGYVLAACWCPDENRWHCHSSMQRRDDNDVGRYLPQGTQYHFMAMMNRSLWDKTGGFDEDYRQGAGYDDPDWVMRLCRAGAKFVMRDDLVVQHPHASPRSKWPPGSFARNRALWFEKWSPV